MSKTIIFSCRRNLPNKPITQVNLKILLRSAWKISSKPGRSFSKLRYRHNSPINQNPRKERDFFSKTNAPARNHSSRLHLHIIAIKQRRLARLQRKTNAVSPKILSIYPRCSAKSWKINFFQKNKKNRSSVPFLFFPSKTKKRDLGRASKGENEKSSPKKEGMK